MDSDLLVPSPERIQEDVLHLQEWLSKQPHLPKINNDWLETFLYNNKFSIEKTKFKLENYYTLRNKYPELLKNRDPTSPDLLQSSEAIKFALSDRLTKHNTRVFFFKYEKDANLFEVKAFSKRLFMGLDLMLLNEENRLARIDAVTDFQNISVLHTLKVMPGLPKIAEIFNGAYTERVRSIHMINLPSFANSFIDLVKKVFPPKIADRIHTHSSPSNTLFDILDEDVVCSDFGGKGLSLDQLHDMTQKDLEKHRKWFEEQDELCSNELLRRKDSRQQEDLSGSFRKLEVD